MNLTERTIRDAQPGPKQRFLWDAQVKGLGVRITPAGSKAYVLDYRMHERRRRPVLARVSEISLREARQRASAELARIRAGESDPLTRRQEAREAPTVNDGIDRFFGEYAPARIATERLTERTAREYRWQADRHIRPAIGKRRIEDVTRQDVERMVSRLAPIARNRILALTSRLFTLFEHWELRPQHTNPARGIKRSVEEPRDRVLSPSELAALGDALARAEEAKPAPVAAIRFAALTGLRISEVLGMQWAHVQPENGAVVLPKTKTGRRVHGLPAAALELLASLPRINEWVFTTGVRAGREAPVSYKTARGVFAAVAADAGVPDARLHDLRRTVMTRAAGSGLGAHVLRDLLGHKTTAMADRYVRHAGAAVRDAQEAIGATIAAQLGGAQPADVVSLDARRGAGG